MPFFSQQQSAYDHAEAQIEQQMRPQPKPIQSSPITEEEQEILDEAMEAETLSEVEVRLIKANYYRAILDQPLFGQDDTDIAYEVEREFRDFALGRLRVLLGIQAEEKPVEETFSEDQKEVLREWANRLMAKPQLLGVATQPTLQPARVQVQPQVQQQPKPQAPQVQQVQIQQQPAKKRGRPPGTGKNQRAEAARIQTSKPSVALTQEEIDNGVKADEKGKFIEKTWDDPVTGQTKVTRINLQDSSKPSDDPNFKPMPTDPLIYQQKEMAEAAMAQNKLLGMNQFMGQILNHFQKGE